MQTLKLDTKKQSVKMVFERPGDQNEQALNRKSVEIRHTIDVYTTMKLQFLADRRNYGLAIRLCQSEIFMPQTYDGINFVHYQSIESRKNNQN